MPELAFKKVTSSPYLFFGHCTAKIKILLWNFAGGLCVCMLIAHLPCLWISWKFWIICAAIYEKWNFQFWGTKSEISQIRDAHFVELSILRLLTFFNCVLLQNWRFQLPSSICLFLPKMSKHEVTKTPFSQNFLDSLLKFWWQTSNLCWGRY